jgi:heme-degrading monooxygenase HmoA
MVFVSITRLRIRSVRFLPGFALYALRTVAQVKRAGGFRGGSLMPDRSWTFWTMTAWESEAAMRAYMLAGAHKASMPKLLDWCDEASVVHWEQAETELPTWTEADRRMRASGRISKVRHPSAEHAGMQYPEPRVTGGGPIRPAK